MTPVICDTGSASHQVIGGAEQESSLRTTLGDSSREVSLDARSSMDGRQIGEKRRQLAAEISNESVEGSENNDIDENTGSIERSINGSQELQVTGPSGLTRSDTDAGNRVVAPRPEAGSESDSDWDDADDTSSPHGTHVHAR
ncbi:hypothetical protein QAD02_011686 [Eretmocerus hayati]|uniref:Uncharacterized protein n=1 Tax=Eretmocerus hayati TaxID=131215 RepID=A0ACC2P2B4_9HYME|nr:hypothetical protein QAD02_011686 [Eretmocerus hayati]